ncbi:hypothetical protein ACWIB8_03655 [Corynebacterium flavescens]
MCDLSQLVPTPLANLKNFNLLEDAGLNIHVVAGIVSGPVLDDDTSDRMCIFAGSDLNTQQLYGTITFTVAGSGSATGPIHARVTMRTVYVEPP